jgi:thiamine-phosphate pyrophosphorylase
VTLCLVTDRRRLCGADASSFEQMRGALDEQISRGVAAGVDLIQIRERDLEPRDLATLVADAVRRSRGTTTRVVVNERLDVAMACGADGVHLRGDSVSAAEVRRIVHRGFLVGRSVHSVDEARGAGEVDYLMAGTVFPTVSKTGAQALLGVGGLRGIVSATRVPVLAIGGATLDRVEQIAAAGAAGMAAIGLFIGPSLLGPLVDEVRRRFDSVKSGSLP